MKPYRILLTIVAIVMFITLTPVPPDESADDFPTSTPRAVSPLFVTEEEKAAFMDACREMAAGYRDIYLQAEKVPSPYLWGEEKITQPWKDKIEDVLIAAHYPVFNSHSTYPDYLEYPEVLREFWNSVQLGSDAAVTLWGVAEDGGLYCTRLSMERGNRLCTYATAKWNEQQELELGYMERRDVFFWNMTPEGDFYYQDLILDRHWTATRFIRLQPVDEHLHHLYVKYIEPVGYRNSNLFLVNWTQDNYGDVCFNDLIQGLYPVKYGEAFHSWDYPSAETPFLHNKIPAVLFEEVILPHFDISPEAFRIVALYDAQTNSYPMRITTTGNVLYYPEITPVVTDCVSVDENTFRLTVRLMCLDYHREDVLTHEVTIRTFPDGGWHYLANKVIARSDAEQPPLNPRLGTER